MKYIKTGGRLKGAPNKKTNDLKSLILNKYPDFNPILSMVELYHNELTLPAIKFQCLKEISQYLFPKRKTIDIVEDIQTEKPKITIRFVGVDGKEIK